MSVVKADKASEHGQENEESDRGFESDVGEKTKDEVGEEMKVLAWFEKKHKMWFKIKISLNIYLFFCNYIFFVVSNQWN